MLNAAIELHDSTVEEVRFANGNLAIAVSAYVHRSTGTPGIDNGSGWVQGVIIDFQNGTIAGNVGDLPAGIFDGDLQIGLQTFSNMIALPCDEVGPIYLTLFLSPDNRRLVLSGDRLTIRPQEEGRYVEDFLKQA